MTKYPNRAALYEAHNIYRDAMRLFIVRCLKRVRGERVEDLIRDSLPDPEVEQFESDLQKHNGNIEAAIDIKHFPHIIGKYWHWDRAFSQQFDPNSKVRYKTGTIVEGRNSWAHPRVGDLDIEDTQADLTYVAQILGEINDSDAKKAVENIRDRLVSGEPPPEEVIAALKEKLADMANQLAVVETEKEEYAELLDTVEKEKVKIEKQFEDKSNQLNTAKAENADFSEQLEAKDRECSTLKVKNVELEERLETVSTQLKGAVAEKTFAEERLSDTSNQLEEAETENTELKKRLSEAENRLRTVESERDEHIKTLTERPRTVEAEKTILEEHPKNSPKQPEIKEWRRKIWKQLCDYAAQKDTPVRFHKPGSENYLNVSRSLIALTGFNMKVWLGRDNREIAIRLYMGKQNFYILEKQRKEIEQEFCESLEWEKLPQRSDSRISLRKDIINPTDESDWQNQLEWVISKLEKFHKKFNEVFLPRIQELNTSNSLSEDEEDLPLNPATLDSVTFQGTTFTKRLNKYRVEGDEITQTFWHYWHSQGVEGKQEMRDAGWSVKKVNGDWEVVISSEDFESWIEDEEPWDEVDEDNAFSNEVYTESQSYSENPAKSPKYQRKWRIPGAVAALRDPAKIREAEAKIAKIRNLSEKTRLEFELREAKRVVYGSEI